MGDARGKRVLVVAHCLLDSNTRVHGIAGWRGAHPGVIGRAASDGVGLVQLPCPEVGYLGMKRWVASREQYDTDAYRRHVRELVGPTVDTLVELARDGVVIDLVQGVAGSPSCGAQSTSEGFEGGRIDGEKRSRRVTGMGILMQELASMLEQRGIGVAFEDAEEA